MMKSGNFKRWRGKWHPSSAAIISTFSVTSGSSRIISRSSSRASPPSSIASPSPPGSSSSSPSSSLTTGSLSDAGSRMEFAWSTECAAGPEHGCGVAPAGPAVSALWRLTRFLQQLPLHVHDAVHGRFTATHEQRRLLQSVWQPHPPWVPACFMARRAARFALRLRWLSAS